jgi:CRP-like cAMP-binding protein
VRQGERGDTLFVLLSGGAEVLHDGVSVGWLGAGDHFGEMGFLVGSERTATVVARADCEAVVLSGGFLSGFLEKEPAIASRVLLNLSRELARRLSDMNRRVTAG